MRFGMGEESSEDHLYIKSIQSDMILAQIALDGTLPNKSIVTPQGNTSVISGGTQAGSNLFHSFDEFSVPTGSAAHFNNALDIQNIISRVTGESISNIDGLIQANGTANLFLLNPNGIIFGPNASLSIGGSFLGSTASAIKFADGTEFSATEPQTTPLLTVSVPLGLQFGGTAGRIVNQSQAQSLSGETNSLGGPVGLQVPTGQTLALIGGDVVLEFGNLTAAGGRIELGSVAGVGEVSLSQTGNSWLLGYDEIDNFGNIRFTGGLLVDVSGEGGGDVQIQSARLEVTEVASIFADTLGAEAGGEVFIRATDAITLSDSLITADVLGSGSGGDLRIETGQLTVSDEFSIVSASTYGVGNAGDLTIETGQLIVRDGAQVASATFGDGAGGSLAVSARKSVEVIGRSVDGQSGSILSTSVQPGATGTGGNLTIETGRLIVRDGAQVQAATFGSMPAGTLAVRALDSVELIGQSADGLHPSILSTSVQPGATGAGGNLTIETGRLIVRDGAQVGADTFDAGPGGNLEIRASDLVELSGTLADGQFDSGLGTSAQPGAIGAGGNLTLETRRLIVRDGAHVFAGTLGEGRGGTLVVRALDSVELINGNLSTSSDKPGATGAGGNLTLETGRLIVRDGAQVTASTSSEGAAGSLAVSARESVELSGTTADGQFPSMLSTSVHPGATGAGGNLTVETGRLIIQDGAQIAAGTFGEGNGGNLTVRASEVEAIGESADGQFASGLRTDAVGTGTAGNLRIETGKLIIRNGAIVATGTIGEGQGGTLAVTATESVELSGTSAEGQVPSLLTAQTVGTGKAGDLTITTGHLRVQDGAEVSASTSSSGQGGTLTVTAPKSVTLSGIGNLSARSTGNGNAGNLTITTGQLTVQDRAQVSTSTSSGNGGDITLAGLNSLQVSNGGQISASTATGQAGSLNVNAAESVQLRGQDSGLFARATNSGDAGSLTINASQLTVYNGAEATVSSPLGQAGNLTAIADSVLLDRGSLTAVTGKSQGEGGANITLQVQDLLQMRNESQISADALATANGGNININTDFLIAQPPTGQSGSDIKANAFQGNGGRLDITVSGIFGISFRPSETPLNDITASSEFGVEGVVEINTPDVDPSQGLVALPAELVDVSRLIASSCAAGGENEFIVTGRGGLPPSPSDTLSSDTIWSDLRPQTRQAENRTSSEEATQPNNLTAGHLVEAQGWVINNKGEVVLTARAPTVTPHLPWMTPATCHRS